MMPSKPMEGADDTTVAIGRAAENLAAEFLVAQGLQVLSRNFRVRGGEIDLVCRDRDVLVFVEVRLRQHGGYGGARDSINCHKQRRIILAARHYLARKRGEWACRFDCVLMSAMRPDAIEWLRDAFTADF